MAARSKRSVGARTAGREAALQMLYQVDLSGVTPEQAVHAYWAHLGANREGEDFANSLVRGWADERERIDGIIREVSQHWRLERMARVDRNILRLATYELLALEDVPRRVTLNEAVELAKRYATDDAARLVNGILGRIAREKAL